MSRITSDREWSAARVVPGSSAPRRDAPPGKDAPTERTRGERRPGERTPRRRRSRWRVALVVAVSLCLIVAAGWVVLVSSVLGVRSVEVSGAQLLSAEQVRDAAAVRAGAPLARLDTGAVIRRVEALPEVRRATVEVSYPSTVRIVVAERTAVAYQTVNGGPVLVDDQGVAFHAVAQPPGGDPQLVVSGADARLAAAQVSAALPADLRAQVATIRADSVNAVTLTLGDKRTVLWGASQDNAAKVELLRALMGQPGNTFDISAQDIVVVR